MLMDDNFYMLKKLYDQVNKHWNYYEAITKTWKKFYFDNDLQKIDNIEQFAKDEQERIKSQFIQLWPTIAILSEDWKEVSKVTYSSENEAKEIMEAFSETIKHKKTSEWKDEDFFSTIKEYFWVLFKGKISFDNKKKTFKVFWEQNMEIAYFLLWSGLLDYIQTLSNLKNEE